MRSVRSLSHRFACSCAVASLSPILVAVNNAQANPVDGQGWSSVLQSTDIGNPAVHGETKSIKGGLEVVAGGKDICGLLMNSISFMKRGRATSTWSCVSHA
jgi:hypothetical protein